jgi:hypothetical protein
VLNGTLTSVSATSNKATGYPAYIGGAMVSGE